MTISYIISAYQRPAQLLRLVDRLQGPGRAFYLHIDRRAPAEVHASVATGLAGRPDVALLPSHRCLWGDFGHVEATLKGLDRIALEGVPDYVVLLTGQDYPIKSAAAIEARFTEREGASYINHRPLPVAGLPRGGFDRIDRWHFWLGGRHWALRGAGPVRRRGVPHGLRPFFGSGYWCLHRRAVEHVVEFVRAHPDYVRFFERVFVPDELFFQTILAGSPLRDTLVDDDLRFIRWPGPEVLTTERWDDIRTAPDLFARKFDEQEDHAILDRIDRDLLA